MFMELYKFSRLVMHLNSCSMDLGRDRQYPGGARSSPPRGSKNNVDRTKGKS